jgi:hypothetical protein
MMEGSIKMADLHLFGKIATTLKVLRLIFVKRTPMTNTKVYQDYSALPLEHIFPQVLLALL